MKRVTWCRVAVAAVGFSTILATPVLAQDSSTPPVAWWKLNETGGTTALDAMDAHHATIGTRGITLAHADVPTNMPGTSVQFSDGNTLITHPFSPALNPSTFTKEDEQTWSVTHNRNQALTVGSRQGTLPFHGLIDDVQVYSQRLEDDDIRYLFRNPGYSLGNAPAKGMVIVVR